MFGVYSISKDCKIKQIERILSEKKLPQFAFYNYKKNRFQLNDYSCLIKYADLLDWSSQKLNDN
jgi:hypothetical protein